MKCLTNAGTLSKALAIASASLSKKDLMPSIKMYYFEVTETSLIIRSTDLENHCQIVIPIGDEQLELGAFLVNPLIKEGIQGFNEDEPVLIFSGDLDDKGEKVYFKQNKNQMGYLAELPDSFPMHPEIQEEIGLIARVDIERVVKAVCPFSAKDNNSMHVLAAMRVDFEGNKVNFVTANGFILSKMEVQNHVFSMFPRGFNLLPESFSQINRVKSSSDYLQVFTTSNPNILCLAFDNVRIYTMSIEGNYPHYNEVINPVENGYQWNYIIDTAQLYSASKLVESFAKLDHKAALLDVSLDKMQVSSIQGEVGDVKIDIFAIRPEGENIFTSLTALYLKEVTNSLTMYPEIRVFGKDKNSPILIKPFVEQPIDHKIVMMPLSITKV